MYRKPGFVLAQDVGLIRRLFEQDMAADSGCAARAVAVWDGDADLRLGNLSAEVPRHEPRVRRVRHGSGRARRASCRSSSSMPVPRRLSNSVGWREGFANMWPCHSSDQRTVTIARDPRLRAQPALGPVSGMQFWEPDMDRTTAVTVFALLTASVAGAQTSIMSGDVSVAEGAARMVTIAEESMQR